MFETVNKQFQAEREKAEDNKLILESVGVGEITPGSDEEDDELIDVDSIEEEDLKGVEDAIDALIEKGELNDEEIEQLLEDEEEGDE